MEDEETLTPVEDDFPGEEWNDVPPKFSGLQLCVVYLLVIVCAVGCGYLSYWSSLNQSLITILCLIIEAIVSLLLGVYEGGKIGSDSIYTLAALFFLVAASTILLLVIH